MPRKGEVPKRKPLPDPKFTDQPVDTRRRVTKFVNTVMHSGKKAIAERVVYRAFDIIAERSSQSARGAAVCRCRRASIASKLLRF